MKPIAKKSKIFVSKKEQRLSPFLKTILIILGITLGLVIIWAASIAYKVYFISQRHLVENEKNEMRKLPPEIKRKVILGATASATFRMPILMYHYVEYVKDKKDTIRQSLDITPNTVEKQIQTLQNAGYTFITAGYLGQVLDGKKKLPTLPIILTFDDGYGDFYTDAFPLLKKYNVKATAYIISGVLGKPNYMTSSQVVEIAKSGLVEIGAHTVHHLYLKGLPSLVAQYEIYQSKSSLEQLVGTSVVSFAYPYGAFDQSTAQIVKSAGFTNATSTIPGIEANQVNRYFIYRIRPGYRVNQELLNYLSQNTFKPW